MPPKAGGPWQLPWTTRRWPAGTGDKPRPDKTVSAPPNRVGVGLRPSWEGTVAFAVIAREQRGCLYENPPPSPCSCARSAFAGFRFPPDVIMLAVRWYLRFGLSYRDVEELLAERGVEVDHVTIYRWVQRFTPLLAEAARPCRHAVGDRWQVDETYVKVAGRWRYVYRAIDQFGQVIDVFVSPRRDANAARRFFERAMGATKIGPSRSQPIGRRCIRRCWRSYCQRHGIAPTSTPTTASSAITAG